MKLERNGNLWRYGRSPWFAGTGKNRDEPPTKDIARWLVLNRAYPAWAPHWVGERSPWHHPDRPSSAEAQDKRRALEQRIKAAPKFDLSFEAVKRLRNE